MLDSSSVQSGRPARYERRRLSFDAMIGHTAERHGWIEGLRCIAMRDSTRGSRGCRGRQRRCGCWRLSGFLAALFPFGCFPGGSNGRRCADQLVSLDAVPDGLEDLFHDGAVVPVVLVITNAHHPPSGWQRQSSGKIGFGSWLRIDTPDAFDNAIIKLLSRFHHLPPLFGLDPQFVKELVFFRSRIAEVLVQLEKGHDAKVWQVPARIALQIGREAKHQLEIDCVFIWGLPLEDLGVSAHDVPAVEAGKDETVVAVQKVGHGLVQHHLNAIGQVHLLDLDVERAPGCSCRVAFEIVEIRRINEAL